MCFRLPLAFILFAFVPQFSANSDAGLEISKRMIARTPATDASFYISLTTNFCEQFENGRCISEKIVYCGASLISQSVFVTAGNCVHEERIYGSWLSTVVDLGPFVRRQTPLDHFAQRGNLHEMEGSDIIINAQWDIAIGRLRIQLPDTFQPVPLCEPSFDYFNPGPMRIVGRMSLRNNLVPLRFLMQISVEYTLPEIVSTIFFTRPVVLGEELAESDNGGGIITIPPGKENICLVAIVGNVREGRPSYSRNLMLQNDPREWMEQQMALI